MKKTQSYLSLALLSKNPCEEKSLYKKLEDIDKMKNKILRQSAAKMTNFAIQHLYIAKYYDAKNGEQCRPPLKVAQESVGALPRLTPLRKQSEQSLRQVVRKSTSLPETFDGKDCATSNSRPTFRRSMSDKSLSLSELNSVAEKVKSSITTQDGEITEEKPKSATADVTEARWAGRRLSEASSPKSNILDNGAQPAENIPGKFHAWTEKENEEKTSPTTVINGNSGLKPKYRRSLSQSCVAPSKVLRRQAQQGDLAVGEGFGKEIEKGNEPKDERKLSGIRHREAAQDRRRLQRRVTVASGAPSITREVCRWQQTVKLVKDLPKNEQAEIFRGACFLRMALPSSSIPKLDKPYHESSVSGRQRKISTIIAPCRQELSSSNWTTAKYDPLF